MALVLLGAVTGGAAYLYHERARLYEYPWLADWVVRTCAYLGCEVPPQRALDRIRLVERKVYSLPQRPGVVMVTATLVNRAPFAQPYPLMQLSFTDLQGRVVASHRLAPHQYLRRAPAAGALMPPNAHIAVQAEMPDPGKAATAFQFAFL
jgi:hypothetical protein